jgi:hypothetical protein
MELFLTLIIAIDIVGDKTHIARGSRVHHNTEAIMLPNRVDTTLNHNMVAAVMGMFSHRWVGIILTVSYEH